MDINLFYEMRVLCKTCQHLRDIDIVVPRTDSWYDPTFEIVRARTRTVSAVLTGPWLEPDIDWEDPDKDLWSTDAI